MGSNCCKSSKVQASNFIHNFPDNSLDLSRSDLDFSQSGRSHQYRRGNKIGEGTTGKVYQALDEESGQLTALKVIKLDSNQIQAEKQFNSVTQEVQILKSLRHVNIVKYIQTDVNLDLREISIVLEYVPGGSLRGLIEKYGALSPKVIKNYGYQIIKGLSYLHNHNVIHRDLKSANVLVTDNAIIKLTDFGCSKKCEEGESLKSIKGSPYWIAPEVLLQEGYSFESDIWSFGCLLIEMATGHPPWSEYSDRATEVIKLIMTKGKLPKIPQSPPDFYDLVSSCLNRNAEERPSAELILRSPYFLSHSASCSHSFISKDSSYTWYENK
jgi:serine/threonine protein kinase